jgi:hypothetical protein
MAAEVKGCGSDAELHLPTEGRRHQLQAKVAEMGKCWTQQSSRRQRQRQ